MLSLKYIRDHRENIQKACVEKNMEVDVGRLLECDQELRAIKQQQEGLQSRRNALSKSVPTVSREKREGVIAEVKGINTELEGVGKRVAALAAELRQLMLKVPQPARADVPVGGDESGNVVIRKVGEPPSFSFPALDHTELALRHGMVDFQRAAKVSGSRSYVLTGRGALLEQAVLRMVFDGLVAQGFTPMSVPVLVKESAMEGTGYFPLGREQTYLCEKDRLALVGTSEVSMCAFYSNDLFNEQELPLKCMAQTSCFRREAGSYGRDTKGLYRVHQFQKIEQVIIAPHSDEGCEAYHKELLENAERMMRQLELPYQVVMVCTGDLGQGQYYKHDIETWMPSREAYGETHSCSSFRDFQARRLNLRYKAKDGGKYYCYTLNNTAVASPRILIPFLENHQTEQGDVFIPQGLRPYLRGKEYLSEIF